MGFKVTLNRESGKAIILMVDDAGVVSFNGGQEVVMYSPDRFFAMLRVVVDSMKANKFTTVEVEKE